MARLTVEEILARPIAEREVDVPEWGGSVLLRALTSKQRQEAVARSRDATGQIDGELLSRLILQASLADPSMTMDQIEALEHREAAAMDILSLAIADLAGLGKEQRNGLRAQFFSRDDRAKDGGPGGGA